MSSNSRPELPSPETSTLVLDLPAHELDDLRERARAEGVAPEDDAHLLRYLVHLGAAYLRAERLRAELSEDADETLYGWADATRCTRSALRFAYGEAARTYGMDTRAIVAEARFVASFTRIVEAMEDEAAARRERIRALEEALDGG